MNETISTKYNLAPETIEKRSLNPNDRNIFKKYTILSGWEKLKITKWEMTSIIRKLIEEKEH